ncbi:MAG: alpha/beta hydrolase-fold protein [Bacteroidales bacterium]
MKQFIILETSALLLLNLCLVSAEVTMIVTSMPPNTPQGDNIYIAGNFQGWNPGDPDYVLQPNLQGKPQITIQGTGTIEFKFTRGDWQTVEGNENGGFLPNRTFTFGSSDTLEIVIQSWEDLGGSNHTAAENVIVMDESFFIPQLNRNRRIWLYLPPDYETTTKHYPVLYMHDGQNLFDLATSFAGEWEVDETLNALFDLGKEVPIVVGIDNGGIHRINEYTPWINPQHGGGEGDLYATFIVETLKPYIDQNFRTKPEREFTGVMGSSLGGLISHYIGLKYQDLFSKAGIFSPSFWFSDSSFVFAYETGKQNAIRYYMMGGTNESGSLVQEMNQMKDTLNAAGFSDEEIFLKVVQGGQHNEYLWRTQFKVAYEWLFLEGASNISTYPSSMSLTAVYSKGKIYLFSTEADLEDQYFEMEIYNITGQRLAKQIIKPGKSIALPYKFSGICVVKISGLNYPVTQKIYVSPH